MSASTQGVGGGTTPVDLAPNVTGNGASSSFGRNVHPNTWAWIYIIAGLGALWGLGRVFR